jgi:hypothetical protein
MSLYHALHSKHSRLAAVQAKAKEVFLGALQGYEREFGKDEAAALVADLRGSDAERAAQAQAVLFGRVENADELVKEHEAAQADLDPLVADIRTQAADRAEVLRHFGGDVAIAVPPSERDRADFEDAALAVVNEDADGGAGRFFARRMQALPADDPRWEHAFRFASEQAPPPDPLADASIEELDAQLAAFGNAGSGIATTSTSDVLAVTEVTVDADLDKSLADMRADLERESPRLGNPDDLAREIRFGQTRPRAGR